MKENFSGRRNDTEKRDLELKMETDFGCWNWINKTKGIGDWKLIHGLGASFELVLEDSNAAVIRLSFSFLFPNWKFQWKTSNLIFSVDPLLDLVTWPAISLILSSRRMKFADEEPVTGSISLVTTGHWLVHSRMICKTQTEFSILGKLFTGDLDYQAVASNGSKN